MSVEVSFYSYQGLPNVAVKSLPTATATKQLNFITDTKPELSFRIEVGEKIDANYCSWVVGNKTQYWFIDNITEDRNNYIYYLTLDVLSTYYYLYSETTFIFERCSSLTPNIIADDADWVTTKDSIVEFEPSSTTPFTTSLRRGGLDGSYNRVFVLGIGRATPSAAFSGVSAENCSIGTQLIPHYAMTVQELQTLGSWLGSPPFWDMIGNVFNTSDPLQAIISVRGYPFRIDTYATIGTSDVDVWVGNYHPDTGGNWPSTLSPLRTRTVETDATIDCGYVSCEQKFDDFRDYPPYTDVQIYLPYIGWKKINPAPYYGTERIYVKYFVDITNGETLIKLSDEEDGDPIDIFQGKIGYDIPLISLYSATKGAYMNIGNAMAQLAALGITAFSAGRASTTSITKENHAQSYDCYRTYEQGNPRKIDEKIDETTKSNSSSKEVITSDRNSMMGIHWLSRMMSSACRGQPNHTDVVVDSTGSSNIMRFISQKVMLRFSRPAPTATLDSSQNSIYGKQVMASSTVESRSPGDFCKLYQPKLPMKGLRTDVYEQLYKSLCSGFYR